MMCLLTVFLQTNNDKKCNTSIKDKIKNIQPQFPHPYLVHIYAKIKTPLWYLLADPGEARGCSTNTSVTYWLVKSSFSTHSFTAVRDRSSSYKREYFIVIKNFINPEGHQNLISGLKLKAILLKGWILPTSRVGSAPAACAAVLFILI